MITINIILPSNSNKGKPEHVKENISENKLKMSGKINDVCAHIRKISKLNITVDDYLYYRKYEEKAKNYF